MSQQSTIEWTDATWNPVRGCQKVSPGCKHCYAETFAERFRGVPGNPYEQGFDLRLVPHKVLEPLRITKPRVIFVNSMSDLFQEQVPYEYIELVFEVMLAADWHTYQVLTKRAQRMAELTHRFPFDLQQSPHIWLGVSVEDRKYGVPRIAHLRGARAHTRFLSVEPLLEDLGEVDLSAIDWVIVGGESGYGARPMEPEWVRSIQSQCERSSISFFFKQWGGVRKKKAGRTLDGCTWDALPQKTASVVPDQAELQSRYQRLQTRLSQVQPSLEKHLVLVDTRMTAKMKKPREQPAMALTKELRNQILQLLSAERDKQSIAEELGVTKSQVAAVAAHVTMGTYALPPRSSAAESLTTDTPVISGEPESDGDTQEPVEGALQPIVLGTSDDGRLITWSPDPASGIQNPHALILGASGSGKTYATLCLISELAHRGIPSVVFDYGQSFSQDSVPQEFLSSTNILEIDIARNGVSLNPLTVTGVDVLGPTTVAQRFADSMCRVFPQVGVQQHAALREAVILTLSDAGIIATKPSSWGRPSPSMQELRSTLRRAAEGPAGRHAASVEAHISSLFVFDIFRASGQPLAWEAVLQPGGCVTVLQLRGLESSLKKAVTELLLWDLWGHLERMGPSRGGAVRAFAVLDEAHNLPMGESSAAEKVLREGRKFGLGILLASQQPEDFSNAAYVNTALKLVFRLGHDSHKVMSKLLSTNVESARKTSLQAAKLPRGHALAFRGGPPIEVCITALGARLTLPGNLGP